MRGGCPRRRGKSKIRWRRSGIPRSSGSTSLRVDDRPRGGTPEWQHPEFFGQAKANRMAGLLRKHSKVGAACGGPLLSDKCSPKAGSQAFSRCRPAASLRRQRKGNGSCFVSLVLSVLNAGF